MNLANPIFFVLFLLILSVAGSKGYYKGLVACVACLGILAALALVPMNWWQILCALLLFGFIVNMTNKSPKWPSNKKGGKIT